MSDDHHFQVDLQGIIHLLSDHLYSGPQVFVRELLQNGVDAITARRHVEPDHRGRIRLEVVRPDDGPPTLVVADDGIGLSEEEVHRFLATIGRSSKHRTQDHDDFLGQFGIGLLSGFVVSDEIVMITRSWVPGSAAVEWRGRSDGTYTTRTLDHDFAPGTQVFLRAKSGTESYFDPAFVRTMIAHYGSYLPERIEFVVGSDVEVLNESPPWKHVAESPDACRDALLDHGRRVLETDFLDAIPLRCRAGAITGVAYVLPHAASLAHRRGHRVYLRGMLLSDQVENLLPEWAFFVTTILDSHDLHPNAARDAFHEDDLLESARNELGRALRDYLIELAEHDRGRLDRIIELHFLPIKALAAEDEEFYRLFIRWLPFETSLGEMTLEEYLRRYPSVHFVRTRDQFRQIAGVAGAQDMCVVNGGYVYDTELLTRLGELVPPIEVHEVDASQLARSFEQLDSAEAAEMLPLSQVAGIALERFRCTMAVRKYRPEQVPALFVTNASAGFLRQVDRSREIVDDAWSGVLDKIAHMPTSEPKAELVLNYRNASIRRLASLRDRDLAARTVQMLYVHALLLGHYPLNADEMELMSSGLLGLIDHAIDSGRSRGA